MYTIQANPSGTRSLEVSEENLATIEKYGLFRHLIDSNGIVDETVLDKLKLNIRSLIASQEEDSKEPARPLYRRYLSQQHEGLRTTTAHQALSAMAFPTRHHRRRINENHRTCGQQHYSPLIPAIKAMCEAGKARSWKSSWTTLLPSMT